jgi:hypothetical protein
MQSVSIWLATAAGTLGSCRRVRSGAYSPLLSERRRLLRVCDVRVRRSFLWEALWASPSECLTVRSNPLNWEDGHRPARVCV